MGGALCTFSSDTHSGRQKTAPHMRWGAGEPGRKTGVPQLRGGPCPPGTPLASTTSYTLCFGFCCCLVLELPTPASSSSGTAQPKGYLLQEAFCGFFWPCIPTVGPHVRTLPSQFTPLTLPPDCAQEKPLLHLSPGASCCGLALVQGWDIFSLALNQYGR